jgi:hypothetical protein
MFGDEGFLGFLDNAHAFEECGGQKLKPLDVEFAISELLLELRNTLPAIIAYLPGISHNKRLEKASVDGIPPCIGENGLPFRFPFRIVRLLQQFRAEVQIFGLLNVRFHFAL